MQPYTQRLFGVIASVLGAMVFIYGAFYFATHNLHAHFNVPLWLGVCGMLGGAVMLALGSRHASPPT